MFMKSTPSRKLLKSEAFRLFLEDNLDKKLQHAQLEVLAKFVFGSIAKALRRYELEKEDWEYLAAWKPEKKSS